MPIILWNCIENLHKCTTVLKYYKDILHYSNILLQLYDNTVLYRNYAKNTNVILYRNTALQSYSTVVKQYYKTKQPYSTTVLKYYVLVLH